MEKKKKHKTKQRYQLDKCCGCRDRNACSHHWHMRVRIAGKRTWVDLTERYHLDVPMRKDEMHVHAAKMKDEARRGLRALPTKATLGDVADRFMEAHPSGKRYYLIALRNSEIMVNGSLIKLERNPMADITADDLKQAAQARVDRAKKGVRGGLDARCHLLTTARRLFNWAIKQRIVRATPFRFEGQSLIEVPTSGSRHRRLQGDEETRLLDAADTFTKDRIVAALELGSSHGELLNLTWAEVLDHHVVLTTRKTRTRQPKQRKVTISPTLRKLLDRRKVGPDGTSYRPRRLCSATRPARRCPVVWIMPSGKRHATRQASRKTNRSLHPALPRPASRVRHSYSRPERHCTTRRMPSVTKTSRRRAPT